MNLFIVYQVLTFYTDSKNEKTWYKINTFICEVSNHDDGVYNIIIPQVAGPSILIWPSFHYPGQYKNLRPYGKTLWILPIYSQWNNFQMGMRNGNEKKIN